VVVGGHEPDVLAQQHPVAEHVAAHVADADDGELVGLGVDPELLKVTFYRLPNPPK